MDFVKLKSKNFGKTQLSEGKQFYEPKGMN